MRSDSATAATAREEGWPYEQFLEALLEAEVFAREASGARKRIRHAAFPAHKTLEDFDFAAQPAAERPLILHLAQLAWVQSTPTSASSARPAPARRTWPSRWRSGPARPGTASRSPPPSNGSTASKAAQHRNASTRAAAPGALRPAGRRRDRLPALSAKPRTCCSRGPRRYERGRSSSPATVASRPGAKSSATPWSPPPSSTGSSTTPTSSRSRARATDSESGPPRRAAAEIRPAGLRPTTSITAADKTSWRTNPLPESGALFGSC